MTGDNNSNQNTDGTNRYDYLRVGHKYIFYISLTIGLLNTFRALNQNTNSSTEDKIPLISALAISFLGVYFLGLMGLLLWYIVKENIRFSKTSLPWSDLDIIFTGKGEDTMAIVYGASLIEPRAVRSSVGIGAGSSGFGIGYSQSSYAGDELKIIDEGNLLFDSKKIQFIGEKKQIPWSFNRLLTVRLQPGTLGGSIFLPVNNRKNISGFFLKSENHELEKLSNVITKYAGLDCEE